VVWKQGSLSLISKFVGAHFWLPTLAAVASAIELGVPLPEIAARVACFEPLFSRCGVLDVHDGPRFIVDTTKAPWYSIPLAFEILASAQAPRKRIVLGHMSDFADSTAKYRDVYRMARAIADQVIFVGDHRHRSKASDKDRNEGRFLAFGTVEEVSGHIRRTAFPGEVILLKASADLHLERVALSFRHEVKCWKVACGKVQNCLDCGLFMAPYDLHKGRPSRYRRLKLWERLNPANFWSLGHGQRREL
jgi:UDP-N-acetylmuramoyl-tripeptide--D-alanyl-D-alanine ligase